MTTTWRWILALLPLVLAAGCGGSGDDDPTPCQADGDCGEREVCDLDSGDCQAVECTEDAHCAEDQVCDLAAHACVDVHFLQGRSYLLDFDLDQWVEPVGVADIIADYVPTFVLGVAVSSDTTLQLLGGLAPPSGAARQDLCQATVDFPEGPLGTDLAFDAGPAEFPFLLEGFPAVVHDLHITGTFAADGSGFDASPSCVLGLRGPRGRRSRRGALPRSPPSAASPVGAGSAATG